MDRIQNAVTLIVQRSNEVTYSKQFFQVIKLTVYVATHLGEREREEK